jgi:hypothetical protein
LYSFAQGGDVFAVVKGQAREMQHVVLVLVLVYVVARGQTR